MQCFYVKAPDTQTHTRTLEGRANLYGLDLNK